jgi:hypothetical protein
MNVVAYNALLFLSASFALWRGGAPERLVAASFVCADMLTLATLPPIAIRFRRIDPAILTIDLALLIILSAIALRANRYWTLLICGLHLASVYAYLARVLDPAMPREALRFLLAYGAYLQVLTLAVATTRHRRRVARYGADPAWS